MTKELLQQALNEAKADAIEVFTYEDGIAQSARDAIEYMYSWLGVYFEKQALAQQEQPESWTRHPNPVHHIGPLSEEHLRDVVERTKAMQVALDAWVAQAQSGQTEVPCPLAFVEQPASVDAYVGAREDAAIWKKRALEAEELNRKFIADVNGPTYLGEPVKQEQPAQEPCGYLDEFGNFENMLLAWTRMKEEPGVAWAPVYKRPAPTQPALSDDEFIAAMDSNGIGPVDPDVAFAIKELVEAHFRGGANHE
jgi:hypothetical protein